MARLSIEALANSAASLQACDFPAALAIRKREYHEESDGFDDSTLRVMELILTRTPHLLRDCPKEVLEPLRVAAAMMELWGTNSIRDFVTIEGQLDYRFGFDAIAHMLNLHGCFLQKIEDLRNAGISKVQLIGGHGPNDCEACRAADESLFTVETVPELPLVGCTCKDKFGCRVFVVARE
jgi:hypothetical protein